MKTKPKCGPVCENTQALRVINSTCSGVRGNCRDPTKRRGTFDENTIPLSKRSRSVNNFQRLINNNDECNINY